MSNVDDENEQAELLNVAAGGRDSTPASDNEGGRSTAATPTPAAIDPDQDDRVNPQLPLDQQPPPQQQQQGVQVPVQQPAAQGQGQQPIPPPPPPVWFEVTNRLVG